MNSSEKRWVILPEQPQRQALLQKELHISPLLSQLLINRNITNPDSAQRFLSSSLSDLRPPFLMKDIKRASRRIIEAVYQKEAICIFGDYDMDGITGTAILKLFLDSIGGNVFFYIPQRLKEGYGLNIPALEKIRAQGASLVITVDCGISDYEEISFARDQGIDIIVTDHHEVPEKIPEAYAVINPKQEGCSFPFKHLAGVGVAFYLIIALRKILREEGFWSEGNVSNLREYLDLVALGTVADVVPLVEENRIFVKHGLEVLNQSKRLGLLALKKVSGVENTPITSDIIAYRLAPRINVGGRLGQAEKGVVLLTTSEQSEAERIAKELNEENSKRRQIESTIFKEACRIIEGTEQWPYQKAFVLESPDWHQGVIGIGASRIVERYYRPTILISLNGDIGHGSARSIEAFHIFNGLKQCQELLEKFGGHEFAAGLTVSRDNINKLREKLNSLVEKSLNIEDFIPKLYIDAQIDLTRINGSLLKEIQALAPFGANNPNPLFATDVLSAKNPHIVGNGHLKMRIGNDETDFDAIGFGMGDFIPSPDSQVRVVFTPEINIWRDVKRLQIKMKDLQIINK
ncbi:MAG: single-stranded-DNA-specific exonuclease RecJ [Deltaproteobacteria bacterium]|nr:single-stranded-DNA-specific exonuclease RecJ [Deltaproteobacteria bacterium]